MNLDELKIKVSIDLDDFNKQLSAITKGIDKAFGPKVTKKMMQANHKIIKKESAEINKTLNQAFELDFTKFNTNLNKAMNQAKRTVQQTCREIRSEINSAFDIKGTVRITGKASVSNSSSSQRSSESAAIIQSSQYTGAMINKAVNEMIRTNNTNTTRIEAAISNLGNKLVKAVSDINSKPVATDKSNTSKGAIQERDIKANTIIETSFKVIDDELQSVVNKAINAINVPKLEVETALKLTTESNDVQDAVNQVVQYVQAPEILASLDLLDSGVQEQLDDIVDSINISNLIIELTAEEYNIQDEIDDIVDSVNVPEIIVNVLAEDNDVQDTVDDIADSVNVPEIVINVTAEDDDVQGIVDNVAESVDVPEVVINITAEDNNVQSIVDDVAESVNIPEIVVNVTAEDSGVQEAVDDITYSIDIPELVVQLTVEDADIQNEVDRIIRGIDVPELTANIELLDTGIQYEVDKTVESVFVPELLSELRIEAKDLQDEVNRILGNVSVPVLIADISLLYSDVQGQVDKAIKSVDVPKIPILFEINQTELQSKLNSVASELRLPKIALPVSVAKPKTKEGNKTKAKEKEKAPETPEQTAVDVPVNITGDNKIDTIQDKLKACGSEAKKIRAAFLEVFASGGEDEGTLKSLEEIQGQLEKLTRNNKGLLSSAFLDVDDEATNKIASSVKNLINDIGQSIDNTISNLRNKLDGFNELSITIDDDDIFGEMSEVVDKEIEEIKGKLKDLNMMYKSMFNRSVIGESFKYDLNVANDSLDRTHKKLESLKDYIYNFGGFTDIDTDNLEQKDITPSLVIDDNESFSDFGDRINNEIDSINENLKNLSMRYTSLFNSSEKGSSFEYDINLANNSLKETIKTVEKLSVSLQKLKDYAGFQNKFEAPEPVGTPMLQDDSLNGLGQWFEDTVKLSGDINALKEALQEFFNLLNTPVETDIGDTTKEIENLKNKISNLLDMLDLGHGLDSFKDKVDEDSGEIEQSIENIIMKIAKLCDSMDEVSKSGSGADIGAFKELENIDSAVLEEIARLEKSIAEDEARRIAIIAELEKGYKHLKEDLSDIKDMTDKEFELEFDLDETKEDLAKARKELLNVRETFKNISRESNIEIDVKTIRDCISLIEKLQAKIDKIEAANAKLAKENEPKPEKVKAPKEVKEKEPKPSKPDDLLQKEKDVKLLKDYLLDVKALSDEDFKIAIESSDSSMKDLLETKENLINLREEFREFNANNELQFNLAPIRDCISLIDKLQDRVVKIQAPKIEPEIKEKAPKTVKEKASKPEKIKESKPTKPDDLLAKEKEVKLLKDELLDIKALSDEDFELVIDFDSFGKDLITNKIELMDLREEFRKFNENNDLQFNLAPIRDCLTLIDKLQAKINKIEASKIVPEIEMPVDIPEPEKVDVPTLEPEPSTGSSMDKAKLDYIEVFGNKYKALKEELIDVRNMSDEDFSIKFDDGSLDEFKEHLVKTKEQAISVRESLKGLKNDGFKVDLKSVRDCISLIDKIQGRISKLEKSKIAPSIEPTVDSDTLDLLRGFDFADEIELNLGIDKLKEQLEGLTSVENLGINLDDLRRDIVILLEDIDKIRSTTDDEIKIQVIDDEVTKIVELLKLLDEIRERSRFEVDIDTSDAVDALEELSDMQDDIRNKLKTPFGVGSGLFSTTPGGPVGGGGSGGNGGGRIVDSGSFDGGHFNTTPDIPDDWDTGIDFNAHIRDFNMGKIIDKFKEMSDKIKPILKDISATIKDKLKGALSGALGKLASVSKSMWSKITGIFKKGAKDSANATNTLRDTVKDLAKQFFSLYALWNGAKMAIQSAEGLIQGEQKLTTVMRNRMGATNDSVKAIKDLIAAQQQLGVVGKEVQYNAAQQLSVFLQSSKALETLIPSMNNLIAQQYGANASLEEGAEVARKLGQAITEGEFTELQESTGITLSEAEVEKFRNLATEEERAAMLSTILADRIGNMNQELANTPYGAISQLKNNFMELLGTVGTLIVTAIKPLVQWLNQIVIACTKALKAFGEFFGFSFDAASLGISGGGSVGEGIDDTTGSIEDATKAAEKFKGSLMGFDEINILSDNTNKSENQTPTTDGSVAGGGGELVPDTGGLDLMSDKMKAFIDEILTPFRAAWDILGERWIAAWERLKTSFANFCDSLATFLKSVWENGGQEFVRHMAEIALAIGIAAMEIGGTILDALAKLWQHLDPETNMNTQGFLDAINTMALKLRELILSLNGFFESLMNNGGQELLNAMGDCFMNLGEAAARGVSVVIDAISGLLTHLDAAANQNTVNMLAAWTTAFGAIGQAALDFVTLLESTLVNGGQNVINSFGDMLMNLSQTVAEIITTIMTAFSGLFEYLDPATNEITQGMLTAWENAFGAVGESALAFSDLLSSTLGNGGQEVLNALGDAFNSFVGLVGTVVEEVSDALTGLYEHLDPKTNEFTQGMLTAWQTAFEEISQMCSDIGEVLGSVMDNGGQELLNALGDLAMQISETFGTIVGEVAEFAGELFKHLDPNENRVAKGALDAFKYFVDTIRNFVEMLGNCFSTFMDNGGRDFLNNVADIILKLVDLGLTIGGDLINSVTAFFDSWVGQTIIEVCARALDGLTYVLKALLELLDPLTPVISAVVAAIGGFMAAQKVISVVQGIAGAFKVLSGAGGVLAVCKTAFTALWGVIMANPIAAAVAAIVGVGVALVALYNKCDWFRNAVDKIFGSFKGLFDSVKEHVTKIFDDIVAIFKNVIDIIVGIFTGDGERVGTAVRELAGNILKLLWDGLCGVVDIGLNLITGLAKGIWNAVTMLPTLIGNALKAVFDFVIDFFKGLFGIHSPSTVFAEFGVNLIEGLAEGIVSMISALGEAWQKIGDAVFDAITGIVTNSIENWKELGEAIFENMGELYDNVSEKWNKIKDKTVEKCKETYDKAKENYDKLKDTLTTTMDNWRKNNEEKWSKIKEKTSELVDKLKKDSEDKYNKMKEALTTTMENWRKNNEEKWTKIKDKTFELSENLKKTVEDKYTKFKDNLTTTMDNWRQNSEEKWTKIKDKTTELSENLKKTVEDKYTKFKDNLTTTMENWRKNSEEKWTKIKDKTTELSENLKKTVEDKYTKFKDNLTTTMENWRKNSEDKWTKVKDKTTELSENLKKTVEDKYTKFKNNLTTTMENWRTTSEDKWNKIKEKTGSLVETLRSNAEKTYGTLKTNLGNKINEIKSDAETKWNEVKNKTVNKVSEVVSNATTKYSELKGNFTNKMDEVKTALGPKWEALKTNAKSSAEDLVRKAGDGLRNLPSTMAGKMGDALESMKRKIKDLGNIFSSIGDSWKLPKIKVDGEWSLNPLKVPKFSLQWNARGGIIDGMTPLGFANGALQMGGEAGKEMVVPLENTSFTSKIAQAMGQAVDNAMARNMNNYGVSANNNNDSKDIVLKVNERELARASINSINKLQRESGRTLLDI